MPKRTLLSLLPLLALLAFSAACGDGDDGDRVRIHHLDFEGVELTAADLFDPPFADQYPAVVAEVNGEPIMGEALTARQVMLELNRRHLVADFLEALPEGAASVQLADIETTDPLEALIDEELMRQAVERLGLIPPYEEAAAFARQQEQVVAKLPANDLLVLLAILGQQVLTTEDWASNRRVVEAYQQQMGIGALRNSVCAPPDTPEAPLVLSTRRDCDEFLDGERENADIRYFVEWAD